VLLLRRPDKMRPPKKKKTGNSTGRRGDVYLRIAGKKEASNGEIIWGIREWRRQYEQEKRRQRPKRSTPTGEARRPQRNVEKPKGQVGVQKEKISGREGGDLPLYRGLRKRMSEWEVSVGEKKRTEAP